MEKEGGRKWEELNESNGRVREEDEMNSDSGRGGKR